MRTNRQKGTELRRELYAYIYGIAKNLNCQTYRIGGMPDYLHIFVSSTRKKFVIQSTNHLIINTNSLQKFVITRLRVKKPLFSYTFALEKRTQNA